MKRKLFVLGMAMVMALSGITTTLASTTGTANNNKVDSIMELYEKSGYNIELEERVNDIENYHISSMSQGVEAEVIIITKDNGDKEYSIVEGELQNTIKIDKNGKMFIDNEPIMITEESNGSILTYQLNADSAQNSSMSNAAHKNYNTETCPYGSARDYSAFQQTEETTVSLGKQNLSTAGGATLSIILGKLNPYVGIAGTIATAIITIGQNKYPECNALSIRQDSYYHKTKGLKVQPGMAVTKYVSKFYANRDYSGEITTRTTFNVIEY